eukprot:528833-Pleurochrysis_carterae.AAC.1
MGPEGRWRARCRQVGAGGFHDRFNRSFSRTIQLVDVWRARGGVHTLARKEFSEFAGKNPPPRYHCGWYRRCE